MSDFYEWFEYHSKIFFSDILYILCLSVALVCAATFHRNSRIGKYFLVYLSIDLLLYFSNEYLIYFSTLSLSFKVKVIWVTNAIVAFIELIVYLTFFKCLLPNKKPKKMLTCFQILFSIVMLTFIMNLAGVINLGSTKKFSHYVTTIEFLLILIPCIMYYINILSEYSKEFLSQRPSFWVVTGVFQLTILSIPFYSINYFISFTDIDYYFELTGVLFYVPLAFNYLLLSKAFLCQKPLII